MTELHQNILGSGCCRAMPSMHKRGLCRHAVSVCVSIGICVCVFVKFVHCVKTNKDIFIFFHCPHQTGWQYTDGNPPNGGVECRCGKQKSRFWAYLALVPAVSTATCQVLSTGSPVNELWHIAGGKWRCWLWEKTRRNVYDKKPRRYAKDNRTAHLTARSDESVAYVTNNKRFDSTFCTVEATYWQIRSIARLLCDSRAKLVWDTVK